MKKRAHGLVAATALITGLALVAGTGTANAGDWHTYRSGKAKFNKKGDILTVKDTRRDHFGIRVYVNQKKKGAKGYWDTVARCQVSGYGKKKVCNLNLREGRKYQFSIYVYNPVGASELGNFYSRA
ncbi:hypothetical protein [Streptomyces sp. KR80]|uniref:hypothetical protein n=1 Tax=Streptomyces sp. KR80 TaxID=3457426 RepID=UPI003FCEF7F2